MNIKGMLFDLDGTLANTIPMCINAYRQTFERLLGRLFRDEEITAHFGLSDEGIIQRVVPDQAEAALRLYYDVYEKMHAECGEPFTDIKTVLDLLKQRDIKMAVVTGKGTYTAHLTLKYLGIEHYFDKVEAGDAHANVKAVTIEKILAAWQMKPCYAAYVGDADTDMLHAAAAGVLPLAACWAETATIHRLSSMTPFATFANVRSFIDWLDEHISMPIDESGVITDC
ncbi:MAG: HAD family hydrolase [Ktedonobacteraceae bacterium]